MAKTELVPGTLILLVLRVLESGPLHGYAIAQRISRVSGAVLRVEEGSLYPALYRMVRKGWIKGEWGVSENNRRAKFYELTTAGRREFEAESDGWLRLARAVSRAVTSTALPSGARP